MNSSASSVSAARSGRRVFQCNPLEQRYVHGGCAISKSYPPPANYLPDIALNVRAWCIARQQIATRGVVSIGDKCVTNCSAEFACYEHPHGLPILSSGYGKPGLLTPSCQVGVSCPLTPLLDAGDCPGRTAPAAGLDSPSRWRSTRPQTAAAWFGSRTPPGAPCRRPAASGSIPAGG